MLCADGDTLATCRPSTIKKLYMPSYTATMVQALAEQVNSKQTQDTHMLAEERKRKNYADFWNPIPVTEPFRVVLSDIRDRLYHTRELLHHCLVHSRCVLRPPPPQLPRPPPLLCVHRDMVWPWS